MAAPKSTREDRKSDGSLSVFTSYSDRLAATRVAREAPIRVARFETQDSRRKIRERLSIRVARFRDARRPATRVAREASDSNRKLRDARADSSRKTSDARR